MMISLLRDNKKNRMDVYGHPNESEREMPSVRFYPLGKVLFFLCGPTKDTVTLNHMVGALFTLKKIKVDFLTES